MDFTVMSRIMGKELKAFVELIIQISMLHKEAQAGVEFSVEIMD